MTRPIITKELINCITYKASIREKAFFAIMRQSGLSAVIISRLRLRNIESNTDIPRKIDLRDELSQKRINNIPYFIGEEANRYLTQYLAGRKDLTGESFLFATKKGDKPINTKNVSRTFRKMLENVQEENQNLRKKLKSAEEKFSLKSLRAFYRENAKFYEEAIKNNPNKDDFFYESLYKEKALPFLEIESQAFFVTIKSRREFRKRLNYAEIVEKDNKEQSLRLIRNTEFISSILTLLYNNKGDLETRKNVEIGDNFIELWKEVSKIQIKNAMDFWNSRGKIKLIPYLDIVDELTKTLKRIKSPYDELEGKAV